ncbi:MAG: hypothetical protein ACRCYO_15545 [Bacteroidia bacterium]
MGKIKKYRSDFLFSTPSFWVGAGSVLNVAGNYFDFNSSENAHEADAKALQSDWGMVSTDIDKAIAKINEFLK